MVGSLSGGSEEAGDRHANVTYDGCWTAVLSEGRLEAMRVERWDIRSSDISYGKTDIRQSRDRMVK